MITADTSVLVAAFGGWHGRNAQALNALAAVSVLSGHVALEFVSVMTRMPPPRRTPPQLAAQFLTDHFSSPKLTLGSDGYDALVRLAVERGIIGGAIYDALVALTAKEAGMTLLTLDERAASTYHATGVEYQLLS